MIICSRLRVHLKKFHLDLHEVKEPEPKWNDLAAGPRLRIQYFFIGALEFIRPPGTPMVKIVSAGIADVGRADSPLWKERNPIHEKL